MSTIKVNSIQNTSGVEVYTAKAWVNFNGTGTVAIRASGNVSSITDNGVGDYTVNFGTAMSDANYTVVGSGKGLSGSYWSPKIGVHQNSVLSASSARINVDSDGAVRDSEYVMLAFFR